MANRAAEQLSAGMNRNQIAEFASEYVNTPPRLNSKEQEAFDKFQEEVSYKFASDLLENNPRLDRSFATRLEAVAYEKGRLVGWGKPDKKDYKSKTEEYASAVHAYEVSEAVGIRAVVIGTVSLQRKEFESIFKRGIAEGKREQKSPIVDRYHQHKIEHQTFQDAIQKAVEKHGQKGKQAAALIEGVVFPKRRDGSLVFQKVKLKELEDGMRSARYCAQNDTETTKVFDDLQEKLTGYKASKKTGAARAKELAMDRAAFLAEPASTPLTLKVFREKIAYVIAQSGFAGVTPEAVMKAMSRNITHIGTGKNEAVLGRPIMLRELCGEIFKTQHLTHESGRALLAAVDALFTPEDFRKFSGELQGATLKTVQENFMRKMLPKILDTQTAYTELAKNEKGFVVMTATGQSLMYMSDTNPEANVTVKPNTMVLVDAKDMKTEKSLVKVWVDGLPYYMTKISLAEIKPEVKSKRRKEEKAEKKVGKIVKAKKEGKAEKMVQPVSAATKTEKTDFESAWALALAKTKNEKKKPVQKKK